MATATAKPPAQSTTFAIQPITFEIAKEALEQMVAESSALTVAGVDDKQGIAAVRESRLEYKRIRVNVEARRKELKADALEYGRQVDGMAKALTSIIEPEEKRLQHEEDIVKREQERIAREAEEKRQAMVRQRLADLQACGKAYLESDIAALSDEEFAELLASEQADKKLRDAEAARLEAERKAAEEKQRVEAERLKQEREEFERQQKAAQERTSRMRARISLLAGVGYVHIFTDDELADMTPQQWETTLTDARRQKKERDDKEAAERAALEKQRLEQEAERRKQEAERQRIEAEKLKLLSITRLRELQQIIPAEMRSVNDIETIFMEAGVPVLGDEAGEISEEEYLEIKSRVHAIVASRKEAAEKVRLDAIAEQDRQVAEAKAKAEADERERQRLESLKPDHEKLLSVADAVSEITVPAVSEDAAETALAIEELLKATADEIAAAANRLVEREAA